MFGKKSGYDIFLGGTTNDSTWREEFIELIKKINPKMRCFNPVVDDWTPECIELENFVKYHSLYHVYVLTPRMIGIYSIAEMCESTFDKTKRTFFYIKEDDVDDNGNTIHWESHMKRSLAATSNLLISHGAHKATSMEELIKKIVEDYNEIPSFRTIK